MPYIAGRVATFSALNPEFRQKGFDGAIPALQSFYYDITESANPYALGALLELVPANHLLFGSDIPFAVEPRIALTSKGLAEMGLEREQLQAIDRDSALEFFPRLGRT